MLNLRTSFFRCLLIGAAALLATAGPVSASPAGYSLSWADEFTGSSLDFGKWNYRYLGPRHDGVNVTDAVSVGGGNLTISTYTEGSGATAEHHTGMIGTQNIFQQQYGYFEASIDFNGSPSVQQAFWLQSPTYGNPIGDPGTAGTEIDIVEHRATNAGLSDISDKVSSALHWDGYGASHQQVSHVSPDLGLGTGYHTYAVEWTPTSYKYYIDDVLIWAVTQAVSDRDEYIVLSAEVKDNSWSGQIPAGGYGSLENTNTKMIVDYVRVYQVSNPGDLNDDGFVGLADMDVILNHWNQTVPVGDRSQGDIAGIGDGFVGLSDLDVVLANWNMGTPPSAGAPTMIPEPTSLALLGISTAFAFIRPRTKHGTH